MTYFLALLLLALAPQETNTLVDGVARYFARMNDFHADFVQSSQDQLNRKRQNAGHVYLMKSKKMRWEYKTPDEQLFVSDGKTVYFYVPADKQVNREAVKETFDDRMPLMFLLGRTNLRDEFRQFELLPDKPYLAGDKVIRMTPRRKTDLTDLRMEVDPATYQIRRLAFAHEDGSRSEFIFSNIRVNTGLKASQFEFKVPPGVAVVEGFGQ